MRGHIALYVPNRTEMKIYFQPLALTPKGGALFRAVTVRSQFQKGVKGFDDILPEAKGWKVSREAYSGIIARIVATFFLAHRAMDLNKLKLPKRKLYDRVSFWQFFRIERNCSTFLKLKS